MTSDSQFLVRKRNVPSFALELYCAHNGHCTSRCGKSGRTCYACFNNVADGGHCIQLGHNRQDLDLGLCGCFESSQYLDRPLIISAICQ